MSYIVRIFNCGQITDIDLANKKNFSIGSSEKDDYSIVRDGVKPNHLQFQLKGNIWKIKCLDNVLMGKTMISEKNVNDGDTYVLRASRNIAFVVYSNDNIQTKRLNIAKKDSVIIGRNAESDIQFLNNRISGTHSKIYKKNGSFFIEDMDSTNGTFVNYKKVSVAQLTNNDVISIGIYDIVYNNNELIINNVKNDLNFHVDADNVERDKGQEYPYFKRSPRLKLDIPTGEIEVQAPPAIGTKPEINWLTVLVPPLSMIGIMIGVVLLTGGNPISLFYTAPMSLISIVVAIMNYTLQVKKHRKKENLRLDKYKDHITEVLEDIKKKTKEQLKSLNMAYPSLSECFDFVRNVDRRLWEKKPQDSDFMTIKIGNGTVDFSTFIKIPKNSLSIEDDALKTKPDEIYDKFSKVENAPIVCPMLSFPTCGLVGDRKDILKLTKNMIAHVSALHCYTDVKIVTVFTEDEKKDFEWVKWLPHSFDEDRSKRYIASSKYAASELFKELEEVFKQRELRDYDFMKIVSLAPEVL